jgi:hypothetical protein
MEHLKKYQEDLNALSERLKFDIPAVRKAEESGLNVVLIDPRAEIMVTPSAVKSVWCAIHAVNGDW